ncbi:hypothetical protein TNCV_5078101 [Trichonephila clavipes]|uniref:Uncharacterized protein n=1 Tax=Trichonephila clavipes TaxID=2585209 RepID=A0A8X6VBE8_TRICX|nr:hypothetical protein TNCV_5078101 [Trichonephila clavipes]
MAVEEGQRMQAIFRPPRFTGPAPTVMVWHEKFSLTVGAFSRITCFIIPCCNSTCSIGCQFVRLTCTRSPDLFPSKNEWDIIGWQ